MIYYNPYVLFLYKETLMITVKKIMVKINSKSNAF